MIEMRDDLEIIFGFFCPQFAELSDHSTFPDTCTAMDAECGAVLMLALAMISDHVISFRWNQ